MNGSPWQTGSASVSASHLDKPAATALSDQYLILSLIGATRIAFVIGGDGQPCNHPWHQPWDALADISGHYMLLTALSYKLCKARSSTTSVCSVFEKLTVGLLPMSSPRNRLLKSDVITPAHGSMQHPESSAFTRPLFISDAVPANLINIELEFDRETQSSPGLGVQDNEWLEISAIRSVEGLQTYVHQTVIFEAICDSPEACWNGLDQQSWQLVQLQSKTTSLWMNTLSKVPQATFRWSSRDTGDGRYPTATTHNLADSMTVGDRLVVWSRSQV